MKISEHIKQVALAGQQLRVAAVAAGPGAPVPTCPDWVVRDLVRHQGGVHRWATGIVAGPRTESWDVDLDDVVGTWPDDDGLLSWFDSGVAGLVRALSTADPDLACWTFLRAPSPLAMWARRQAHETTMHGVDAELAAGLTPAAIPAGFAADGVDELLTCFITRPFSKLRAETEQHLQIRATDAEGEWLVTISPDGPPLTRTGNGDADSRVCGTAEDLYLALWNRRSPESLTVEGDPGPLALFLDQVHVQWS